MANDDLFDQCRRLFLEGIIDALNGSKSYVDAMQRTARGTIPVNAFAFEVYPWFGSISLAFRTSDIPVGEKRYAVADWPDYDFANNQTSLALKKAADFANERYRNKPESMESIEAAHFLFLSAAEALLDPSVAETLQSLGIDAPKIGDGIGGNYFEYLVLDADETCKANYCDIVRANRTTARLAELWNRPS